MKSQKKINNTIELNAEIDRLKKELGISKSNQDNATEDVVEDNTGISNNLGLPSYINGTWVYDLLKANAFGLSKTAYRYSKGLMKNKKVRNGIALAVLSVGAIMLIKSMFEKDDSVLNEHENRID
ncbi:MAG: hypothetical protein ACK5MG_04015 [Bacteroidales bacterium]